MSSRISTNAARSALMALLAIGIAFAQAEAQQPEVAHEPVAATVVTQSQDNGPRVRPEMPRTQASFRFSSSSSAYKVTDHTTTIRISTIVLVLAVVILLVVLL